MGGVYAILGAERAVGGTEGVLLAWWLGSWRGSLAGVLTDAHRLIGSAQWTSEHTRLAHIGAIQKALPVDGLDKVTGLSVSASDVSDSMETVLEEVAPREFGSGTVVVDGVAVPVDTLLYRGLEFAFGAEPLRFPFAMFRLAGTSGDWPELVTVSEDRYSG